MLGFRSSSSQKGNALCTEKLRTRRNHDVSSHMVSEGIADGSVRWHRNSGTAVGTGWQQFKSVVGGDNGLIYAI